MSLTARKPITKALLVEFLEKLRKKMEMIDFYLLIFPKIFLTNCNNLGNSQLIRVKSRSHIVLIKVCAKAILEILVKAQGK